MVYTLIEQYAFHHNKNKVWRAGIPDFSCPEGLVESFAPEGLLKEKSGMPALHTLFYLIVMKFYICNTYTTCFKPNLYLTTFE